MWNSSKFPTNNRVSTVFTRWKFAIISCSNAIISTKFRLGVYRAARFHFPQQCRRFVFLLLWFSDENIYIFKIVHHKRLHFLRERKKRARISCSVGSLLAGFVVVDIFYGVRPNKTYVTTMKHSNEKSSAAAKIKLLLCTAVPFRKILSLINLMCACVCPCEYWFII